MGQDKKDGCQHNQGTIEDPKNNDADDFLSRCLFVKTNQSEKCERAQTGGDNSCNQGDTYDISRFILNFHQNLFSVRFDIWRKIYKHFADLGEKQVWIESGISINPCTPALDENLFIGLKNRI